MSVRPFPDISDAAWTVLLRAPSAGPVTADLAAGIVGPDLAAGAVAELDAKHLIDEEGFSPLAARLRHWHQPKKDNRNA
jgi:hypothetical protein